MRAQLEVAEHTGELVRPDELLPDVDRLSRLVEDLLLLARTDADRRGPATPSMFDAEELLRRVADTYLDARVPVTVSTGLPEVRVCADRDELGRAVRNLVDNAVRHASTRVHLSARSDGAAVTLSVADDGPGIAAPERERVFERFTRLDTARRYDGGGSGLGLAIVRELVGRADGTVGFVTGPEHELVAEIVLPAPTSP